MRFSWILFIAAFFVCATAGAQSPDASASAAVEQYESETSSLRWFSDWGIAFRAGAGLHSRAVDGSSFDTGYALGPELLLNVLDITDMHGILLTAGYMGLGHETSKGTAEISVESSYSRFDTSLGYEFRWSMLVVGARVGAAFTLVKITSSYGEPGWSIVEEDGENVLEFYENEDPEESEDLGVSTGFLAGAGVGIAIGEHLFDIPGLIELRAQSDYVRRGARNEILIFGNIVFWPSKLF